MRNPIPDEYLVRLREIADPLLSRNTEMEASKITDAERIRVRSGGLGAILAPPRTDEAGWPERVRAIAEDTEAHNAKDPYPVVPDGEKLVRAQQLFATYGNEIAGALLLAGLPQTYAAEPGSAVLTATGRLQQDLRRRVRGTAQFLLVVMQQAAGRTESDRRTAAEALWKPYNDQPPRHGTPHDRTPPPWKMCAALRIYHQLIREDVSQQAENDKELQKQLGLEPPEPQTDATTSAEEPLAALGEGPLPGDRRPGTQVVLNQEDLLGTLLTFTIAVFEVLELMGITWSADDEEAYLHAWDVVGLHLGIGDSLVREQLEWPLPQRLTWQGLRPLEVQDSEELLEQIRRRQWLELPDDLVARGTKWKSARPGRLLVRALTEELALAMPPRKRTWPLALMRYFAPDVVQERLLLGAPGVILGSMKHLSRHSIARADATCARGRRRAEGRVIRMMSNEVTRRSMVHFIREGHIVIPGLEDWSGGFDLTDGFGRV